MNGTNLKFYLHEEKNVFEKKKRPGLGRGKNCVDMLPIKIAVIKRCLERCMDDVVATHGHYFQLFRLASGRFYPGYEQPTYPFM